MTGYAIPFAVFVSGLMLAAVAFVMWLCGANAGGLDATAVLLMLLGAIIWLAMENSRRPRNGE